MKYPTLQKVMLTSMALVASLALSAQAGTPSLSSAKKTKGSNGGHPSTSARQAGNSSWHRMLFPNSTYMIDDGTAEDAVGFGNGAQNFESIWFNQFDVIPGQTTITTVSVVWGTPVNSDPAINGTPTTIGIWSDPNGDGNPSDAALLGQVSGTMQSQGTDTFVTYVFSPAVTLPGGATSFFVGDLTPMNNGPQHFYQGIDQSSTLHRQSWVAAMSSGGSVDFNNPGNNDFIGLIDDFGLPGNWLIRADTGEATPTPTPTPTSTPTPPPGDALWYNGDFNDVNGLANERDTFASGFASVYDDFNVPDADGWHVTSVFSNNLVSTTIIGATWEIRQGVSAGNEGTLIASGMTVTPNVVPTGRSGFGFTEYMVTVDGLNVDLSQGDYFLNVTPTGNLDGNRSFDSTTSGANCIGTPCGNNQNAFFNSPDLFGFFFASTADLGQPYDFSMGVNGTVNGTGGEIVLSAKLRRQMGKLLVALNYTGTDHSGTVDILRDGVVVHTANDTGRAQDRPGAVSHVEYTYQVCETGTSTCSNTVTVRVP